MTHQGIASYTKLLHTLENQKKIPDKLLEAIAFVESGQVQGSKRSAHPWTINVHGKGYIFKTKAEAIAAVKAFQKKGFDSIDVGIMQINLKHHPKAFKNLDEAFDPQKNIAYAGKFLYSLFLKHGSWYQAVRYYHSANAIRNHKYLQRVLKAWANEKTKDLFQFNKNGLLQSTGGKIFDTIPETLHNLNVDLETESKKTIPISVSFFPLKLSQPSLTKNHSKIAPGAIRQTHNTASGQIFPIHMKKIQRKAGATQKIHVIPLSATQAGVFPLR